MSGTDSRAERRALRQRIRAARRAITAAERARVERALCRHIRALGAYRRARRVAIYLAFDGEPSLAPLIRDAARRRKHLFVPVLRGANMHFERFDPAAGLVTNFFGILEPAAGAPLDARLLDLVLTPLVAFDSQGVRVGVGRGYYDRCFEFLHRRGGWTRPKLLGVGFELQHVPSLTRQSWDVPLWGAVTEAGVRLFHSRP